MQQVIQDFISNNAYILGGVTAASVFALYLGVFRTRNSVKALYPSDTVILHTLQPSLTCPSTSPFPIKLELYFRLAGIPYKREHKYVFGKKGKFPWITYNGEDVCDSQFIIEYFNNKLGINLNKELTDEQKGAAKAIQAMVDEHLYWCMAYFRWIRGYNSPEMTRLFSNWLLRRFIKNQVHRHMYAQGMGRHSHDEIIRIMKQDLQALQNYLGDKPYIMGAQPTEVDCSVFGALALATFSYSDELMVGFIEREFPPLYRYVMRIKDTFWSDWDEACKESDKFTIRV